MKKVGVSTSGVFTIKEYLMDDQTTIPELIRMLEAGPGEIQEVISYVFDGEDPLKLDARSFDVEEFLKMYPQMESYGSGLAFDVVMQTGGQPLTVELTQGEQKLYLLYAVLAFTQELATYENYHYCFIGNSNYFTP